MVVTFLILLIVSSLAAVMCRNLLLGAMSLGIASIALAVIMMLFGAQWAGVFELSVCAGLITVLFASAVSLVTKNEPFNDENPIRFYLLPVMTLLIGVVFYVLSERLVVLLDSNAVNTAKHTIGYYLWRERWFDVVGQVCIFISGVLMVKTFFGRRTVINDSDR